MGKAARSSVVVGDAFFMGQTSTMWAADAGEVKESWKAGSSS